jgi:hypothetical protein
MTAGWTLQQPVYLGPPSETTGFDAWNTPGWSSQDPDYPDTLSGDPGMPMGVTKCVITGTYMSASGKGYYGSVALSPSIPRVLIEQTQVLLAAVRGEVTNGRLQATIYAVPQDVIWEVREAVGASRHIYDVILPRNTYGADLTELEKVTPETPPINPDNAGMLFTGEGPPPVPPDYIEGAVLGDTYLDTLTGDLYTLE